MKTLQSMGGELAPWFHNLHLPDGRQTAPDHPLGDFPAFKWRQIAPHVPVHLAGRRALDIGCNAGFYSFELARRGAQVTAIDSDERYLAQARWAARQRVAASANGAGMRQSIGRGREVGPACRAGPARGRRSRPPWPAGRGQLAPRPRSGEGGADPRRVRRPPWSLG